MDDVTALDSVVFEMTPPAGYERSGADIAARPIMPAQLPDQVYGPAVSTRELADDNQALNKQLDSFAASGQVYIATPPRDQKVLGARDVDGVSVPALERRLEQTKQFGELTEAIVDQKSYPFTAIGRLTSGYGAQKQYCTAWVVSERVIATAGHCVFSRARQTKAIAAQDADAPVNTDAGLADWTLFEPAYRAGVKGEQWAGVRGYMLKDWVAPEEGAATSPHDFAFIVLDKPILEKTGALGVQVASPDRPEAAISLGYPQNPTANFAFDGRFLYASSGNLKSSGLGVMEAENQLTEGSSGGPWLSQTKDGVVVTGINSNKPLKSNDTTFSPILGQSFAELLARVLSDMTGV